MSGIHWHRCASPTSGFAFVYFTAQYYIEHSSTVSLFQAQDVRKQASKTSDVAGTAKERQEVTRETKVKVFEAGACPPSLIADDPSALPSPTSSPSSSQ